MNDAIPATHNIVTTGDPNPAHCYFCGDPVDSLAGDPGQWPLVFCHADEPGKAKAHHVECVTKRLAAGEEAHREVERQRVALSRIGCIYCGAVFEQDQRDNLTVHIMTCEKSPMALANKALNAHDATLKVSDQLHEANAKLIAELEKGLAESEADRKLLREQVRVGDVAFQHLHCETKGQPLPDWAKGWMNPREAEATKGMVAELEALLKQMKGSLAHEVMEEWAKKCKSLEAEVKRLDAGWDEANGLALKNGLERQAVLAVVAEMRVALEASSQLITGLDESLRSLLPNADMDEFYIPRGEAIDEQLKLNAAALSTEAGKGWATPEAMTRERQLRQLAQAAADKSVKQALHAVEDLLASAPLSKDQVDALVGYVNGYLERGVPGCWHTLATGIAALIKHAHTLEASHAAMRAGLEQIDPACSCSRFPLVVQALSTDAGEGWVSPAQLETIKQSVDRTLAKELEGAISGEEANALRLKAHDRDEWQQVAMKLRAELDALRGVENNLPLYIEQKRCAELERELEQARADRNKAGMEERRKYLPILQALGAALAKEREAVAKFLVPWKHHLDQTWLDHFVEAGIVQFDAIGFVSAMPVMWSVDVTVDKPSAAPEVLTPHEA